MAKPFTIVTKKTASKIEAMKLMEQLKTKRLLARMSTETLKGKTMYIVSVGQYETESDAAADAKAVQAVCKCTPSVIKRSCAPSLQQLRFLCLRHHCKHRMQT